MAHDSPVANGDRNTGEGDEEDITSPREPAWLDERNHAQQDGGREKHE